MVSSSEAEFVVVGAGPNGLSAAVTIAAAGRSVVVVERRDEIGGGASTVGGAELTLPGFRHDHCSAVHPLGVGSPFFQTLPLVGNGLGWVHPTHPLAHPLDDGSAAVLDRDIAATGESLGSRADAAAWARLVGPFSDSWDDLAREVIAPPLHWPRRPGLLARFGLRAIRPARRLGEASFEGERARALWAGIAAHSCLPLERRGTAAIALILAASAHAVGWPFPRGGAQAISDALAAHLRSLGGRIETGREVTAIDEVLQGDARGGFDSVALFDVTPRQLLRMAGEARTAQWGRYARALERYRYGPGVFKVDWALSGPIPWTAPACRAAGTVHVGGSMEEIAESERAAWSGRHHPRPFVLVAQQSVFDDSRAPAGTHTGWAYCHVPHGSTEDMTDAIESQIERFAPGFRDVILKRATHDAAEMERWNPNLVGGDINGGAATVRQLLARPALRIDPYATPDPRVFLCSSSTPPGGGVHGMCGHHAARSALRRAQA